MCFFLQVPRLTQELTSQHATECLVKTSSLENLTVTKLIAKDDILVRIYLLCNDKKETNKRKIYSYENWIPRLTNC